MSYPQALVKLFVTGGARSGKSRFAQTRAEAACPRPTFLATAQALDGEMKVRIARHQEERGARWSTVEEPVYLTRHIGTAPLMLLDCLTLWLSNLMHEEQLDLERAQDEFLSAVAECPTDLIIVSNELGMGLVPATPLGRDFRDRIGILNQRTAALCDEAVFMAAGLPLWLKGGPK